MVFLKGIVILWSFLSSWYSISCRCLFLQIFSLFSHTYLKNSHASGLTYSELQQPGSHWPMQRHYWMTALQPLLQSTQLRSALGWSCRKQCIVITSSAWLLFSQNAGACVNAKPFLWNSSVNLSTFLECLVAALPTESCWSPLDHLRFCWDLLAFGLGSSFWTAGHILRASRGYPDGPFQEEAITYLNSVFPKYLAVTAAHSPVYSPETCIHGEFPPYTCTEKHWCWCLA